jgi:repressor LexA
MSEENLSSKAKEALRHIRNWLMLYSKLPSIRDLMKTMEYKSPRSAVLLLEELEGNGFLEKKAGGGYRLIKDFDSGKGTRTISIPLIGTVTCGIPILAEQNIEATIPVSTDFIKPGSIYFLLKAKGDSMDLAGINDGDMILVRQQPTADNGEKIVALIDDEATVKEFHRTGSVISLLPRSNNPKHKQIIVTSNFQIQGVVVATIPKI